MGNSQGAYRYVGTAVLFLFLLSCKTEQRDTSSQESVDASRKKILWLDADLAIGVQNPGGGYGDVDDGFAFIQLLKTQEVELRGVSTVFGNTDIDRAYALGKEIRDKFASPDLGVYKGAGEALVLNQVKGNEAVEALAHALEETPMDIMAIGPATNIATLLLLYPELASQIKSVILVAGRRSPGHAFRASPAHDPPFMDFNFELDPQAFQILLQHPIKIVLHPFEISHKVWFGTQELDRLSKMGEEGAFLAERSRNWLKQWETWGSSAYNPFDLLASMHYVSPEGFLYDHLPVQIQTALSDGKVADSTGMRIFKPYLIVDSNLSTTRKVYYYHTPPDSFTEDFFGYFQ